MLLQKFQILMNTIFAGFITGQLINSVSMRIYTLFIRNIQVGYRLVGCRISHYHFFNIVHALGYLKWSFLSDITCILDHILI